jgi:hypothetical protein
MKGAGLKLPSRFRPLSDQRIIITPTMALGGICRTTVFVNPVVFGLSAWPWTIRSVKAKSPDKRLTVAPFIKPGDRVRSDILPKLAAGDYVPAPGMKQRIRVLP